MKLKRASKENKWKQAKGKKYDERKKRVQVAPPTQKLIVRSRTIEPYDHYKNKMSSLIALKYSVFSVPFTLFEPCGGVFIMNPRYV